MPRLLFAQLLLLGLGLGPRGAAAMRSKAKGEPAQLHSSSVSQGLGGECPLAIEWQDKCYNLMGSPLQQRTSNKCKDEEVELANGKKYRCKVAYVCIPTHTQNPEIKAGNNDKMVGWDLSHCQGMSRTVAKKVCMAPPEDICATEEPEIEKKEAQAELEAELIKPEAELIPEQNMDDFECRCTSAESSGEVQAVWVSKSLVSHNFYEIDKKLWAGGGIAKLDSESPCACNSGKSWFTSTGPCSQQTKAVYAPTGSWKTGYFWGAWDAATSGGWQKTCKDTCEQADAKVVDSFCPEEGA